LSEKNLKNDFTISAEEKRSKKQLAFPLAILAVLSFAWFICVYQHRSWLIVFQLIGSWLINPEVHYTPIQVNGVLTALFATILIVILGTISSHLLLANEEDKFIKRISAIGLGLGFTGLITILLADLVLYNSTLNVVILFSICGLILSGYFYKKGKQGILSSQSFLKDSFSIWRLGRPANAKKWLPIAFPIGIIFLLSYYQAIFAPIVHWDATISKVEIMITFSHSMDGKHPNFTISQIQQRLFNS
jgi:hypothetical protein